MQIDSVSANHVESFVYIEVSLVQVFLIIIILF